MTMCVTPPPIKQDVDDQLCEMVRSGSRLSMVDGERFNKVDVDCEILTFHPTNRRKSSKDSYYLTYYDPEALLNDTLDPCELDTPRATPRPKRYEAAQMLIKAPPPPTQTLFTYPWLVSEPDDDVVEQVQNKKKNDFRIILALVVV